MDPHEPSEGSATDPAPGPRMQNKLRHIAISVPDVAVWPSAGCAEPILRGEVPEPARAGVRPHRERVDRGGEACGARGSGGRGRTNRTVTVHRERR
jgi:hypothetical protein